MLIDPLFTLIESFLYLLHYIGHRYTAYGNGRKT